jgi:outer membrane protein W
MRSTFNLSTLVAAFTVALIGLSPMASQAADSADTTGNSTSASSQENPSNYVVLKGGMYSPSNSFDIDNAAGGATASGGRIHYNKTSGFAGEVAVGHYFLPMLAVELGGGYFESRHSNAAGLGDATLKVVPLIATAKVLLPLGIFEPYGLAGIGAYITDMKVDGNISNFHGSTEVTYGFHAGAGFNINFTKNMFAGVEGKYLWAEPSFGGNHIKLDGFIMTADLGFRF